MYMKILPDFDYDYTTPRRLPPEKPSRPLSPGTPKPQFRSPARPKPGFGRRPPPLRFKPLPAPGGAGRLLPGIGGALLFIDLVDGLLPRNRPVPYDLPSHWCLTAECQEGPPSNFNGVVRSSTINRGGNNCVLNFDCLSGQAITGFDRPVGVDILPVGYDSRNFALWWQYETGGGVLRHKHMASWYRPGSGNWISAKYQPVGLAPTAPDPNWYRTQPGADPYPVPQPAPAPQPAPSPRPIDFQWSNTPPGMPPPRPHSRNPPGRNTKERKALSRAAEIGIMVYQYLDRLSEWAEVVDAIYDALPPDVKKRWEKGRPNRQFLDQSGQYGLDGADWKIEALWHNWHRVDAEQAVKNIIKNHVEDSIIGGYQRGLPRNVVNALDQYKLDGDKTSPEEVVSGIVDDMFKGIGF